MSKSVRPQKLKALHPHNSSELKIKNKLSQPVATILNAVQTPVASSTTTAHDRINLSQEVDENSFLKNIGALSQLAFEQDNSHYFPPNNIDIY